MSRTNADAILEQSSMSIPVYVPVAAFDKVTPETVDKSVKEKHVVPDAAQDVEAYEDQTNPSAAEDVGASKELSNQNATTATESFGSSSES
ncbi:hypothetical protein A2U01_0065501, partial [Trifolium medium]|nr:hypothetical protein [Trifolium medium]